MNEQLVFPRGQDSLRETVFVIVDLETTGGSPADAGITEIGAVKVRGGEVIGEFATLVNPGIAIPAFVASLTGITDSLVRDAPSLAGVLPAFLEFARDAVLIAHNAPYDIGFLKGACAKLDRPWPQPRVLDTARMARVLMQPGEVRNCKLATLAAHFRATTTPTHRALDDARATTDVFHALLERAAGLGAYGVDDLRALSGRVSKAQRTKRHLAEHLPNSPGVYVFRDPQGKPLYVGTSRNIRTRVRSYFTASEQRRRMAEMIEIAERVDAIVCTTPLEARVRELRLIASEQPRYNRASRRPQAQAYVRLSDEPAPRLTLTRSPTSDGRYLGPFGSMAAARTTIELIEYAYPLRTCTTKLARTPRATAPGCIRHELGRCHAPCMRDGEHEAYARVVESAREIFDGNLRTLVARASERMNELAEAELFEEAGRWRDSLAALTRISERTHALRALAANAELIAALPTPENGWHLHCMRHGMLAGAIAVAPGIDPRPHIDILRAGAMHVDAPAHAGPAGLTEEARELVTWLESPGIRLVACDAPLALPLACGGDTADRLAATRRLSSNRREFDDDSVSAYSRPAGSVDARPMTRIALSDRIA